jgi:predicted alpha/beta superfamily hydrolase
LGRVAAIPALLLWLVLADALFGQGIVGSLSVLWQTDNLSAPKSSTDGKTQGPGTDLHHTLTGNIQVHHNFHSRNLNTDRDVIVYLPPGYDHDPSRRYPVLYLQDGQNLFDSATAFLGNEWGLDETAELLISGGQIEPLIMVGVYNTGMKRIGEYTPVRDRRGRGGQARRYGRLMVEDLKPFIDERYRTYRDQANTGLGGSSLGGLVTMYLGLEYPNVFGKLVVMSPSVWWANRDILLRVEKLKKKLPLKIWLDIGTAEGSNAGMTERDAVSLRDALIEKGWQLGQDLGFEVDQGAGHNEQAWGNRIRDALKFLYPFP